MGKPVVSRLGAPKGKMIIPVSSPISRDGKYAGVLVSGCCNPDSGLTCLYGTFLYETNNSDNSYFYCHPNLFSKIFQDGRVSRRP